MPAQLLQNLKHILLLQNLTHGNHTKAAYFSLQASTKCYKDVSTVFSQNNSFSQEKPKLDDNVFLADPFLQRCLARLTPESEYNDNIKEDLIRFGRRISAEISDIGRRCELEPPYLESFTDAWGKPNMNRLRTSVAWKLQKQICAEEDGG